MLMWVMGKLEGNGVECEYTLSVETMDFCFFGYVFLIVFAKIA